jgi:hypothetical protein
MISPLETQVCCHSGTLTTPLRIEKGDFDYQPFHDKGRLTRAYQVFGDDLKKVIAEMNQVLLG